MRNNASLLPLVIALVAQPASAQHHGIHGAGPAAPYAGLETRAIKALSPEETADLKAGRGMRLALAAELNGYPGPLHVLEHANALGLTADQRGRVETLFGAMKVEAVSLGADILAAEEALDRQFRERAITPATLDAATSRIGRLQGELRAVHLTYHLATIELLSAGQVRRYGELRGYIPADQPACGLPRP